MRRVLLVVLFVIAGVGAVAQQVVHPLDHLTLTAFAAGQIAEASKTDAEIKREIIARSVATYAGSCPCNTDRAGRSCGRRSAYSGPGGAAPLCYAADVSQKMVEDSRAARGEKRPGVSPSGKRRPT